MIHIMNIKLNNTRINPNIQPMVVTIFDFQSVRTR